jgi:N,N'-diacetyllegionaminate synthase
MKNSNFPYIIAEIGINFEGKLNIAKKLITDAKNAGANAVKFQLFQAETLSNPYSKKTSSQKVNIKKESLYNMWKRMELNKSKIKILFDFSKKSNIDFITSVFDLKSLSYAESVGVKSYKVASSDITDYVLLKNLSKLKKKIYLSTGMADTNEIKKALHILKKNDVTLLHCVSLYPCPEQKANLKRMISLKRFKKPIGYSDHCKNTSASIAAISLGAKVLEKHFTYSKKKSGSDHLLSADKRDLSEIVSFAKNYKLLLGDGLIKPSFEEFKMRKFFRKNYFYNSNLKIGQKIKLSNLITRRPEGNIKSINILDYIGRKIKKNVYKNDELKKKHFK